MAAKIMRLFKNLPELPGHKPDRELFWTEYLAQEEPPRWSEDAAEALRFPTHHEADERATYLNAQDAVHRCFAKAIERDANQRPVAAEKQFAAPAPAAPALPSMKHAKHPKRRAFDRMEVIRRAAARSKHKQAAAAPADPKFWWKKGAYA
jgi:hypothetical protein